MESIVRRLFENRASIREAINDSPDAQYRAYLDKHRTGVKEAWENILYPVLLTESMYTVEDFTEIEEIIESHDASKDDPIEFNAYRDYFYSPKDHPRNTEEYNLAWNHHQKHNPHHWQYWCLINDVDNPQIEPLDIPFKYIAEMLCDWQSAGNHYGNTAYEWYNKQKDRMILSDSTRETVEKYIGYFK